MKFLRLFGSTSQRDAVLASIDYKILQKTMGVPGVSILQGQGGGPVPPTPDPSEPFYIEDISGSNNTVQITKDNNSAPTLTIQKSIDGTTWESMGTTSTTALEATIPANGKLYLRCSTRAWGKTIYCNKIDTTGNCNVGGNIMSLLYGDSFTGNETTLPTGGSNFTFMDLFIGNTHIINASNLLLPATTLTDHGYYNMFRNCTSLTTAPALPATTLAQNCYGQMFANCRSLTTAPALPATTLLNSCYYAMFDNCTSLTAAPVLPATTLVGTCYQGMFQGCKNLNYIKCLLTDIPESNWLESWVSGVASNGTFVKNPNMTSWQSGNSGIPSGWTVEDAAA